MADTAKRQPVLEEERRLVVDCMNGNRFDFTSEYIRKFTGLIDPSQMYARVNYLWYNRFKQQELIEKKNTVMIPKIIRHKLKHSPEQDALPDLAEVLLKMDEHNTYYLTRIEATLSTLIELQKAQLAIFKSLADKQKV